MLDVYELCTAELQEKMLPLRSKFKEVEDKKLEKQQQKVMPVHMAFFILMSFMLKVVAIWLLLGPYSVSIICVQYLTVVFIFCISL